MAIGMAWVSLWNATSLCEGTNEILSVCPKLASLNHCSAVIQFVVPGGADSSSGITCTITAHQQLPVELDWVARWMVIKFICAGFHMGSTLRWRMLCFFFFARRLCFTLSHLQVFFFSKMRILSSYPRLLHNSANLWFREKKKAHHTCFPSKLDSNNLLCGKWAWVFHSVICMNLVLIKTWESFSSAALWRAILEESSSFFKRY